MIGVKRDVQEEREPGFHMIIFVMIVVIFHPFHLPIHSFMYPSLQSITSSAHRFMKPEGLDIVLLLKIVPRLSRKSYLSHVALQ